MRDVVIGASTMAMPAVGLGCMGLSWAYTDPKQTKRDNITFLRDATDLGVVLFDTSDQYGPFTNEELVGEAVESMREQVFLATKGGLVVDEERRTSRDGSPAYLRSAFAASLRRLRTDYVDLYQLHRVDPGVGIERSWETLAGFVQDGRALNIGLSEVSVADIQRAQTIHPVASVQSELSLWSREAMTDVVPYCAENGISFIAYSPLGRGYLTGTVPTKESLPVGDWRRANPRFQDDAVRKNAELILAPVRACARDLGITPAQVALAWVLSVGDHIVAIPGTQRMAYLQQNWRAGDIDLSPEWMERLAALPQPCGARY